MERREFERAQEAIIDLIDVMEENQIKSIIDMCLGKLKDLNAAYIVYNQDNEELREVEKRRLCKHENVEIVVQN